MSEDDKEKFQQLLMRLAFRSARARQAFGPGRGSAFDAENLAFSEPVHAVMFSGGVSEFVYGYEKRNLGDLGVQLGRKLRRARINWAAVISRCGRRKCGSVPP